VVTTFVDTSAIFALLAANDEHHPAALAAMSELRGTATLVTHNYIVLETHALMERRVGRLAIRALHRDVLPLLEIRWVDPALHDAAVTASLAAERGSVSLVDRVSFEFMRRERIDAAFTFDSDFASQGYRTLPH
jgi:predicted nucleic acid-binding protein